MTQLQLPTGTDIRRSDYVRIVIRKPAKEALSSVARQRNIPLVDLLDALASYVVENEAKPERKK